MGEREEELKPRGSEEDKKESETDARVPAVSSGNRETLISATTMRGRRRRRERRKKSMMSKEMS